MAEEEFVRKETLDMFAKGINGDLTDIKVAVRDLTACMNRRFDSLDTKFETERKVGLDAHRRIHKRIDDVGKGHMSKGTAYFLTFVSALALSAIATVTTLLIAK